MVDQPNVSDAAGASPADPTPDQAVEPAGARTVDLAGNVADLVAVAARRGPDHPAFVDPGRGLVMSWGQVDAGVNAEAARLRAAGIRAGDRVLIRLDHGIPFCLALFGALRAGAIAVPVGVMSPERELATIVSDCAPSALVAQPDDTAVVAASSSVGSSRVLGPPDLDARGEPLDPTGGGEDIAVLGYTSGTTGSPRGVRLSHRALLANRAQIGQLRPVPVSPADRVLLQLPMFHLYGLGAGLLQVCWAGATGVLVDRVEPAEVLAAIRAERITVLAGVPSRYRAMLELDPEQLRDGLLTVRLCTAGGAPLAPELLSAWTETTGLDLYEGYGLTESGPLLTSTLVGGRPKPGSVGRPLPGGPGVPGVELRLVGPDGQPHEPDEEDDFDDDSDTGIVAVRGPNLFSGYWPDGAGGPDAEGWFRTSDVGYLDPDGDLHLVDRAVDLVIVNGFNVYPREVERVLAELEGVAESAVVGVPDPRTGEAVKAVVVLAEGSTLTVDQVREHCIARLARYKVPSLVEFADRLPYSVTGKITRLALRGEQGA